MFTFSPPAPPPRFLRGETGSFTFYLHKVMYACKTLLCCALMSLATCLEAQTFSPDFVDGVIYFKLRDSATVTINNLNSIAPNTQAYDSLTAILQDTNFQIIGQVIRPFTRNYVSPLNGIYRVRFGNYGSINNMLTQLQGLSYIEYAEKEAVMKIDAFTPNDYTAAAQWYLDKIHAEDAWDTNIASPCKGSQGGTGIVVAIIDEAVKYDHEDLNAWVNPNEVIDGQDNDGNSLVDDIYGWDFADNDNNPLPPLNSGTALGWSHGTHCAGIAGARTDNATGIASIGYDIQIMSLKCTESYGTLIPYGFYLLTNIPNAIEYAIQKQADIISMSFTGSSPQQMLQTLINDGYAQGIVFVAASGNANQTLIPYPAAYEHVISVAATDQNDIKAYFSNYGAGIDISAPGVDIKSTVMTAGGGSGYANLSGTSMACPLVAGLAALLKSKFPALSPDEVETLLKNTADDIDPNNPNYIGQLGAGRINAAAAMCSQGTCTNAITLSAITITNPIASIFEVGQVVTFNATASTTGLSNAPFTTWWKITGIAGNLNYALTNNLSVNDNLNYTFNVPGVYQICFYANNGEPLCRNHTCIEILVIDKHTNTFTTTIPTWKSETILELSDKSIVWVGHKYVHRMIGKIDPQGQFVWQKQLNSLLGNSVNTYAQLFEDIPNNEVTLFSLYFEPMDISYHIIIATFNVSTGAMTNQTNHMFTIADDFKPIKVIKETNGWSLVGEATQDIHIISINTNEVFTAVSRIGISNEKVHLRDCIKTGDGGYLFAGYHTDIINSYSHAFMLKTTQDFTIKKERDEYLGGYGLGDLGIHKMIRGEDCESYYALMYPNILLKLDNEMNVLFAKQLSIGAEAIDMAVNEADQSIWILAKYQNQLELMSINGVGNKNWCRKFAYNPYQNSIDSKANIHINSENGGLINFTRIISVNNFATYIMKTDRNGLTICEVSEGEVEIGNYLLLFPPNNLFSNLVPFAVNATNYSISTPSISPSSPVTCLHSPTCAPIASFSLSETQTCGVAPTIFNTATNYTTYSWFVNNISIPDPNTYNYVSGSYTLTLQVSDGICTDEVSHTFVIYPTSLSASFTNTLGFSNVVFTPDLLYDCAVYEWDFGDNSSSLEVIPIHSYASPGTYTVCLKVSNICGQVAFFCKQIEANCQVILPNLVVTDAQNLTELIAFDPSYATGIINTNILFLNTFILGSGFPGYLIQGSNILMNKDISFFLSSNSNADIVIDASIFGACQDMWKGIQGYAGSGGSITINSTQISGAEYALTANPNAEIDLADNTFTNNYIGLYVPSGIPAANLPTIYLGQNTFVGGTLLPHTNPNILATSKAGMELHNMTLHLPKQTFQFLNNGILAYDCHLTVNKPTFEHIQPTSNYVITPYILNANVNGSAIYLHGTNSYLADLICEGWIAPNTFTDCKYGVYTELAQTWVSHANMQQMQTGIMMVLPDEQSENVIVGNTIEAEDFGIVGLITDAAKDMHIEGNHIKMNLNNNNSFGHAGIYLGNFFGVQPTSEAAIVLNAIQTNRTQSAILTANMTGNYNFRVSNNNLSLLNPYFGTEGIQVLNSDNFLMSCNTVTGVGMENGLGYHIERSRGWEMSCNTSNDTYTGLMFVNDCTSDNGLKGNDIQAHNVGLLVRNSSYIGTQKHGGNHWLLGVYGTNSALNDGNILLSEIKVHTSQGTTYYPYQTFPLGWFFPSSGTPWADCPTNCDLLSFNGSYGLNGLGESDSLIVNQGIADSLYQAELQYSSNRYLYKKLKDSTALVPSWGAIHDFYLSQQQTSIGKFTDIKDAFTDENFSSPQIVENDSIIKTLLSQIAENDSLIETDSTMLANLHNENKDKYNAIATLRETNQNLQAQIQATHNTYIDSLKAQNSSVTVNSLVEQNEKSINDIFFSTIAKHNFTFTESQINEIENIALQCPYTGGEAVYRARVLHTALTGFTTYNDSINCAVQGINWRQGNSSKAEKFLSVSVVPNPTSGKAAFIFTSSIESIATIEIFNTLGQKVSSFNLPSNTETFDFNTQSLSKGMYYYKVSELNISLSGKFIVEK